MSGAELVERVETLGHKVELTADGPRVVRAEGCSSSLPDKLLGELKANKRAVLIHLVIARAVETNRNVWGYVSGEGLATRLKAGCGVPAKWDRIAAEGMAFWVAIPLEVGGDGTPDVYPTVDRRRGENSNRDGAGGSGAVRDRGKGRAVARGSPVPTEALGETGLEDDGAS